jgi:DNA-binding NarL/FixJ family response regulator
MIAGESVVPPSVMAGGEAAEETAFTKQFSQREKEVLTGLCKGHSNKEIARDLDVSEPTVKLHVKTLYRKLGVANRTQAALVARDQGVF